MANFLHGAISMAAAVAALFFLRFYRKTHDRFFLYFFAAFIIESISRLLAVACGWDDRSGGWFYVLRIVAYGLIIAAIIDKNLRRGPLK